MWMFQTITIEEDECLENWLFIIFLFLSTDMEAWRFIIKHNSRVDNISNSLLNINHSSINEPSTNQLSLAPLECIT